MEIKFKCPKCGCEHLEEVLSNVTQYSIIDVIDDDGAIDYRDKGMSYDGGEVNRYQCNECGFTVGEDETNGEVNTPEELVKWIKEHCKQE